MGDIAHEKNRNLQAELATEQNKHLKAEPPSDKKQGELAASTQPQEEKKTREAPRPNGTDERGGVEQDTRLMSSPNAAVQEIGRLFFGHDRDKILDNFKGRLNVGAIQVIFRSLHYKRDDLRDVLMWCEGSLDAQAVEELYKCLHYRAMDLKNAIIRFRGEIDAGAIREINKAFGYRSDDVVDVIAGIAGRRLDAAMVQDMYRSVSFRSDDLKSALLRI